MTSPIKSLLCLCAALMLCLAFSGDSLASRHGKPGASGKKNAATQTDKAAKSGTSAKKGKKRYTKKRPKKPSGKPKKDQQAANDKLKETQTAKLAEKKLTATDAKHRAVDMSNLGFNKPPSGEKVAAPIDAVRGAVKKADVAEKRKKVVNRKRREAKTFKPGAFWQGRQ